MTDESYQSRKTKLAGLYDEYYDKIMRYALSHIGDKAEAEDIAGEVFLKALDSLKTFQERGIPMRAWLFRIAHNLVIDYLRKITKERTLPVELEKVMDTVDPAAAAERNIQMESVAIAMQQLTRNQQEVLRLRFFGGLTSREVAGIIHKTDGAVREMQRAALGKLRQILGEN